MILDIPKDDVECWERYPKQHWVYDLSRLLDAQNVKWSPFKTSTFTHPILNINLHHSVVEPADDNAPGFIYIVPPTTDSVYTEAYIIKGEMKYLRHVDPLIGTSIPGIIGEVELRISAFITLYFQKFTGVLTVNTCKSDIYSISLKPIDNVLSKPPAEVEKLIKKIYKKADEQITIEQHELATN